MFDGTNFYYKFLYFITSMFPTYPLFILQVNSKFKTEIENFKKIPYWYDINVYYQCLIVVTSSVTFCLILLFILKHQYFKGSTDQVEENSVEEFYEENIQEVNGTVTNFLLGVLLPAVFIVEYNLITSIVTFCIIQILIYHLVMRSTDVFPNILLILLGINLCKTRNDNYVFTFKSKKYYENNVYKLGDPNKSKIHITMYKK